MASMSFVLDSLVRHFHWLANAEDLKKREEHYSSMSLK